MTRSTLLPLASLLLIAWIASPAASQDQRDKPSVDRQGKESWLYNNAEMKPEKSIARQKAEYRGKQRMARLESLRHQGIFVSRPNVSGLPFTNTYRPYWRYYYQRPIVIISRSSADYR